MASTSNPYILITVKAFDFLFLTLHTAPWLYEKTIYLAQAQCRRYEVRYLMGFNTAISSGRRVDITSNSVRRQRGPVAIDLFASLSFTLSVTEIQLCKLYTHFPARFAPMIKCTVCTIQRTQRPGKKVFISLTTTLKL